MNAIFCRDFELYNLYLILVHILFPPKPTKRVLSHTHIHITAMYCYPVKSCRGIALQTAEVGVMGIKYDRQWMVVNEHNVFVAQRGDSHHGAIGVKSLCLVETAITTTTLVLNAPGMPELELPLKGVDGVQKTVRVWDSLSLATDQGDEAADWLSAYLSREVPGNYRLVRMPDPGTRKTELGDDLVGFADGYPFLLAADETLASLNALMPEPLPMNRFRPNLVIAGAEPLFEDRIGQFRIRDIAFTGIKRCGRCPITTIDQTTAVSGKEPLHTLATYNREGNNVYFGMNLVHKGTGILHLGDYLIFVQH